MDCQKQVSLESQMNLSVVLRNVTVLDSLKLLLWLLKNYVAV